jgi:hypothetical protein
MTDEPRFRAFQATRDLEAGETLDEENSVELTQGRPEPRGCGLWCSVCGDEVVDGGVVATCADWPGRYHHVDCQAGCVECQNALRDERRGR